MAGSKKARVAHFFGLFRARGEKGVKTFNPFKRGSASDERDAATSAPRRSPPQIGWAAEKAAHRAQLAAAGEPAPAWLRAGNDGPKRKRTVEVGQPTPAPTTSTAEVDDDPAELTGDGPIAAARDRERARVAAILQSEAALTNPALARSLALATRTTTHEALAILGANSAGAKSPAAGDGWREAFARAGAMDRQRGGALNE